MARPKGDETMETVSVRLPKAMVEEIDRFVESPKGRHAASEHQPG